MSVLHTHYMARDARAAHADDQIGGWLQRGGSVAAAAYVQPALQREYIWGPDWDERGGRRKCVPVCVAGKRAF